MRKTIARVAVVGALASSLIGAAVIPADAANRPWTFHGWYDSYALCSADGVLATRGPWDEYNCAYKGVKGYELWLR